MPLTNSNTYIEPTAGTAISLARSQINNSQRSILSNFYSGSAPTSVNFTADGATIAVPDGTLFRSSTTGALYVSDAANKKNSPVGGSFTRNGIGTILVQDTATMLASYASYDVGELISVVKATSGSYDLSPALYMKVGNTSSSLSFLQVNVPPNYTYTQANNTTTIASNTFITRPFSVVGYKSTFSNATSTVASFEFTSANTSGDIVQFRSGTALIGSIASDGIATISYNAFLGSHWSSLSDWSKPEIKIGTVLETIDELVDWKILSFDYQGIKRVTYNGDQPIGSRVPVTYKGADLLGTVEAYESSDLNKHVKVKISDTPKSKGVLGVFLGWDTSANELTSGVWNDFRVGAIGNFFIRMAANSTVSIGDLVESAGNGCAQVQSDDLVRSSTIGKITSTIKQQVYEDGSYLVTCVLYAG